MSSIKTKPKKERLSFFVDRDLSKRVEKISKQTNQTMSEVTRKALHAYIEQIEKEQTEKELEAGYKANYDYYSKSQEEWEHADKE
ncbi:MAG: ribbon-helix-helix domain-containing protein [Melioribacteraceae bacterium]|nr:ribbon-helix-helix domain-containing protein [Melioribacteraceae bacterium]